MTDDRGAAVVFAMITTHASRAYTPVALRSFFAHTPAGSIDQFMLIDNDGSFDPPDDLPKDALTLVRPAAPRGFAQNANAALDLARARGAALCLLNNDLVFTEGWLDPLLENRRALVSPVSNAQVTYAIDGWSTRASMDLSDYFGRETHLAELAQRHRATCHGSRQVAAVPFFCIMIPPAVYERVGQFDERFGRAGGEDRDYTVRAWLAGIPQELALGSYVLHFQGKSTWRGAETLPEIEARNRQYIAAFEQKWGPALAYAFLQDDWNLFRADPRLARWIADGQYSAAVRHLRSHPALAPFLDRQRQAKFSALCCLEGGGPLQPVTEIAPAYDLCDVIWILVNDDLPDDASAVEPVATAVRAIPDPAGKVRVVRGQWADEASQRNAGLRLIQESGADYAFVLDAGEIYETAELRAAMDLTRRHPQIDCWRIATESSEAVPPAVFLRSGSASFVESRTVEAQRQAAVSADVAVIRRPRR